MNNTGPVPGPCCDAPFCGPRSISPSRKLPAVFRRSWSGPGHLLLPSWSRASEYLSLCFISQCYEDSVPPDLASPWLPCEGASLAHPSQPCNDPISKGKTMARWVRAPTLEPDSLGLYPCSITHQHGDLCQRLDHSQAQFLHMSMRTRRVPTVVKRQKRKDTCKEMSSGPRTGTC